MSERDLLSVARELESALMSGRFFVEFDFRTHLLPAAIIGYFPQALSHDCATRLRPLFDEIGARCTGFWVEQIATHYELDPKPLKQLWRLADEDRENAVVLHIQSMADQIVSLAMLRQCLVEDYLRADCIYAEKFSSILPEHKYIALKHEFVRAWLQDNLPIPPDQFPDAEQIAAIAATTGTVQVTARAGSGKTTTLVRRTYFLIRHCKIPPEQLLLLAFNRAAALSIRRELLKLLCLAAESTVNQEISTRKRSADDLLSREIKAVDAAVRIHGVAMPNVMTFHALAYGLVSPEEALLKDEAEDQGLSRAMQRVIDDHLRTSEGHVQIRSLMMLHFRHDWDQIEGGGFDKNREELLAFRRSLPRQALRGEYVKSHGEKVIADFLFENGVPYKYERNHRWDGFNYKPDFSLFRQAGRNSSGAIIEYFSLMGDPDYEEQAARKREYWAEKSGWDFLEFSPVDVTKNGVEAFRARMRDALIPLGFPCVKRSEDEIWELVKDRAIGRFTEAVTSFVGRCRKLLVSPGELASMSETHRSLSEAEARFIPLALRFYSAYLQALTMDDEDDFDGVMQRAIASIQSGKTLVKRRHEVVCDVSRMRFVSVDEFQDFSELFYRLVEAIRKSGSKDKNVQCFCVGDDWQAINGFAGSDLKYFREFQHYMGPSTQLTITTNYRSSRAVVDAGNAVMAENGQPARIRPNAPGGVVYVADMDDFDATLAEQKQHPGDDITPAILRVVARSIEGGRRIVILCRKNSIPWYVHWDEGRRGLQEFLERLRRFLPEDRRSQVGISTAHKFKGLEQDDAIIIDAVRRSYPLVHPDWIFSRILGVTMDGLIEEERRLFYVAITRAKRATILFTEARNESPFLTDLKAKSNVASITWSEYPPCDVTSEYLSVQVTSRPGRHLDNGAPTYAIREALKLSMFRWNSKTQTWEKTVAADGFEIAQLDNELWARDANGVDVTVSDGNNRIVGKWAVDEGMFRPYSASNAG